MNFMLTGARIQKSIICSFTELSMHIKGMIPAPRSGRATALRGSGKIADKPGNDNQAMQQQAQHEHEADSPQRPVHDSGFIAQWIDQTFGEPGRALPLSAGGGYNRYRSANENMAVSPKIAKISA